MRNYELTLILAADLAEEQVNDILQGISSFLQEQGGILGIQDIKGKRRLLAPIEKSKEGYVIVLKFGIAAGHVEALEKHLKEQTQILRYMLLIAPQYVKKMATPRIAPTPVAVAATTTEESPIEEPATDKEAIDKQLEEIFNEEEVT